MKDEQRQQVMAVFWRGRGRGRTTEGRMDRRGGANGGNDELGREVGGAVVVVGAATRRGDKAGGRPGTGRRRTAILSAAQRLTDGERLTTTAMPGRARPGLSGWATACAKWIALRGRDMLGITPPRVCECVSVCEKSVCVCLPARPSSGANRPRPESRLRRICGGRVPSVGPRNADRLPLARLHVGAPLTTATGDRYRAAVARRQTRRHPTAPAGEAPGVTVEAGEAPQGPPVTHTQTPSTGHPQATHRPSTARPAAARSPLGPRRPRSSFFLLGWRGEAISQKLAERQNLNASDGDPIPRAPVRRLLGPLSTEESRPGHWGACCAQRQTPTAGRAPRSLPLSCHQTRGWQAVRLESTRLVRPTVRWLRRWCHEDMTSTLLAAPRCPASVSAPKRPRLRSPSGRGARGHEVRGLVLDAAHQTPSVAHAHVIIIWPGISSWVERARRGGGDGEGRG